MRAMKEYNRLLKKTLAVAGRLEELAAESTISQDDFDLLMLCTRVQEIARDIQRMTREEIRRHQERGTWE
jgi:hypothetical protein